MNDFEKFVRELAASGMELDEIYEDFDNIIATLEHEQETKDDSDKDAMIDELWDIMYNKFKSDDFELEDAVVFTMLVLVENHPEWTIDNMDQFCKCLDGCVRTTEKLIGKNPKDILDDMKEKVKFCGPDRHEPVCDCEVQVKPPKISLSDEERIRKFLRSLN